MFIVRDSMIRKVDEYSLTSSLKHQYFVKKRPFSTAKTIDTYDYLKPTQRDFKPEMFVLHVGTDDLPLNKSPKEISEDILTLAESIIEVAFLCLLGILKRFLQILTDENARVV